MANTVIIKCDKCGVLLRVPSDKGSLNVVCTQCRNSFLYQPDSAKSSRSVAMTQNEARIKLIDIFKEKKSNYKIILIVLNLVTLAVLAAEVGVTVAYSTVGTILTAGTASAYVALLGICLKAYSTSKNTVKQLEACFETNLDYIRMYEDAVRDKSARKR